MAKRKSHAARRTRYRNPYGGSGFGTWLPTGEPAPGGFTHAPWSGSYPPPTAFRNPDMGTLLFWGALAAAAAYVLLKRPDLPGGIDEWAYGLLPAGFHIGSAPDSLGGVVDTTSGPQAAPGFSNVSITAA